MQTYSFAVNQVNHQKLDRYQHSLTGFEKKKIRYCDLEFEVFFTYPVKCVATIKKIGSIQSTDQ